MIGIRLDCDWDAKFKFSFNITTLQQKDRRTLSSMQHAVNLPGEIHSNNEIPEGGENMMQLGTQKHT